MGALRPQTWPISRRWLVLVPLSFALAVLLILMKLPAALLLGPMAAAILMASQDGTVRIAPPVFVTYQGIVGAMIAINLPVSIFPEMATDWPVFLLGTLSTLLASSLLGWLLSRSGALPGTTAIWGSSPGAATVMTLMSEQFGADMRLVAFMQYMRVVACAVVATLVSRFLGHGGGSVTEHFFAAPASWTAVATAVAIALIGAYAGVRLKIPGGAMLTPMVLGMLLKVFTPLDLELPPLLLAVSYAVVGWGIGMRFSASVLRYAGRVFPRVLTSILALILICGGFGTILMLVTGVDPLTAYLATSPGGADSVAIIAASSKVNMPFVMTMQIARFLCVLIAGPALARLLSKSRPG
ncbi:AbrB family transcriptional regulator [Acidisoma silvae]|uniref:AbrB family transcriptional regulator n=1 Tax=Acidisoma silvae TaxID=2802396 RepID=A0A964DYD9_9PROT|nr:AbrB family transcriptional regulator [Acidisoma silvae]